MKDTNIHHENSTFEALTPEQQFIVALMRTGWELSHLRDKAGKEDVVIANPDNPLFMMPQAVDLKDLRALVLARVVRDAAWIPENDDQRQVVDKKGYELTEYELTESYQKSPQRESPKSNDGGQNNPAESIGIDDDGDHDKDDSPAAIDPQDAIDDLTPMRQAIIAMMQLGFSLSTYESESVGPYSFLLGRLRKFKGSIDVDCSDVQALLAAEMIERCPDRVDGRGKRKGKDVQPDDLVWYQLTAACTGNAAQMDAGD